VYNLIATLLCMYAYNLYIYTSNTYIMKHISEILANPFPAINVDHRPHWLNADAIRKEKACLIEDIFRVMKLSCVMNSIYVDLIGADAVNSFDALYDMSIAELELLLARLSAELKMWMRYNQQESMRSKFIPDYQLRRKNRFKDNDGIGDNPYHFPDFGDDSE